MQQFINTVDSATGDIKLLTITEHRFPFLKRSITGTGSMKTQGEHLLMLSFLI